MSRMCLVVTPDIQKLADKITQTYPEASNRAGFTPTMCAEWIGAYNEANSKQPDFIPDMNSLVNFIERKRNQDGKSFLYIPESITYTPIGKKQQTYTILGTHIYNKDGKEVFVTDSKDRRRVFANLAVQQKRAVVVTHKDKQYVVNKREQIISVATGDMMQWGNENGDRRAILASARSKFNSMNTTTGVASEEVKDDKASTATAIDREAAFENLKKALSKEISVGRSGYLSVTASPDNHNGAPVITVSIYNSGSDMATDEQYRLTPEGNIEARFRWTSDSWKDDWETKTPQYDAITDFLNAVKVSPSPASTSNDISTFSFFSGAASGSDTEWGNALRAIGGNVRDYTVKDYDLLSPAEKAEIEKQYYEVAGFIGRRPTSSTSYTGKLVRRDMMQANSADAVFAIVRTDPDDGSILGGTAYATARAWLRGIPVYYFDQRDNKWYETIYEEDGTIGNISMNHTPTLTPRAAVIGTREITDDGRRAIQEVVNSTFTTINQDNNRSNNKEISYGEEFRRVQEAIRAGSPGALGKGGIGQDATKRLGELLQRELESQSSFSSLGTRVLTHDKTGTKFTIHEQVDPQLFHDVFEIVRHYTKNGELVDLHDDYTGCKCYLNEDGTCGFAIEPDGNLVSVFNLQVNKGFLTAAAPYIIEQGATHLDAYNSEKQPLKEIYEKVFGAKTASSMDYNMEYDHDDIAKNHSNPDVVFMVIGKSAEKDIEEKHFNKDQYDEAVDWQKANIDVEAPADLAKTSVPFEDTSSLASSATTFGAQPTAEQQEAAQQRIAQQNTPKPKPERPQSQAYESALKLNDSRVAQFKRVFSPQQIKDRGAMISNIFSKIIDENIWDEMDSLLDVIESDTASESEKTQAKQRLNALKDPVNGRQLEAQSLGIPFMIDAIKQALNTYMEYAEEAEKPLWQNTLDYFEELFNTQATLDIEEREGIRIIGLSVAENNPADEDNDSQDNGDDEVGHVASGSDGWSFQVRYTNPFDSLSRKVRSMLYEVERPESEKDDLGQTRNYPMGQIYASLLSYLSKNMQNSDDFLVVDKSYTGKDNWGNDITENTYPNGYPTFPVLEQMKTIYPWVQQIIQRLTDDYMNPEWNTNLRYPSTGGSMASQFYTNFRKAYIPYGKVQLGDGKFGITPLNYEMEERAQLDKLEANYNNRMILTSHSIYNSSGIINKENANWLKQQLKNAIFESDSKDLAGMPELIEYSAQHPDEEIITAEDIKEYNDFIDSTRELLQSFGIDATRDSVAAYLLMDNGKVLKDMLSDLHYIAETVSKVADDKVDSFNYILDTRDTYNRNMWSHFFDGRGLITDASYMQSFYDSASKKTKYSYSADNYLMKTFRGACMGTLEQRRAYIDEHFGKFEWFRNQKTGEWRNKWLEYWYNNPDEQKEIPYRNVDNVTDYSGDEVKIRQYSKWEPDDIWQVQNRSYNPESEAKTAFYLAPIFSDSPMSMTVKGPKMSMEELLFGTTENGQHKQGALVNLVNQELWRIGYVQERAKAIEEGRVTAIANFDGKRGLQFCFLPELNSYVFEDTGESFLDRMTRLKAEKATMSTIEEAQIRAIQDVINAKMGEYYQENNSHYSTDHPLEAQQYYNMVYANAAIIQMTTVDLAFYKDDTDFQKRFKEVYAGGIQLNTNSKYGKKTENIILLSDDIITSPSYDKIAQIIDGSDNLSKEDKERIKSSFMDINVADAQAFRSMHSFRAVLDMMGNWTDEMEQALNHFKQGEWNAEDFDVIYQTIKPFVYSVIERNDGFGNSILVPQQNKNSEICALMMYDLIINGLNDSPVYKALSRFMEETVDGDGNQLIDMVQYESAGKVGNQGVVNISFNPNKVMSVIENGVTVGGKDYEFYSAYRDGKYLDNTLENAEENYRAIKADLDEKLYHKEISQDDYNKVMQYLRPTEEEIISMVEQAVLVTNPDGTKGINTEVVHTIPFDNYYQQQPTPEHHIDAEATFGSQTRNIIVADLPENFELTVTGIGKTKKTFKGRDAVIDFYYELLNENLLEDFFGKGNKKGLKDIFESKEALRDAVTEIVRGNPKYGRDFAEALQLDDNGNFVLSPNSPTIFSLMQEIVTSFFKNRITKQTINGAALIQAAGIGLDENLRLEFDEDGRCIGAHCLMPLTSKRFFEPLLETQIINGKEVKVLSPEKLKKAGLDKAIGYRIPTENKSSMMPLIIDGFTPLQNGSAIVLPAEITNVAGSDFDVDKMFIMLLSFYIQNYDMARARKDYAKRNAVANEIFSIFTNSQLAEDILDEDPESFREWFEENKDAYELDEPIIRKIEYDFNKSPKENGRKARNNMIIQMIYGILTSKPGSESVMNPQGFPDVKRAAKVTRILTDKTLLNQLERNTSDAGPGILPNPDQIIAEFLNIIQERYPEKYNEYKTAVMKMTTEQIQQAYIQAVTAGNKDDMIKVLMDSSTKDLEKFIKEYSAPESPIYPQTFAHSHARNMAGANQIGIYAIQGSMDAKYQRATERLREEQQFTINGRRITNVDVSDEGKRLKNVGQMIGASADNGKDPNLSDMGSTTKTAPMIGYMLRAGLSHLEAALIINQPHMEMSRYSSKNYRYWKDVLGKNPLANPSNVNTEMLIKGLISPFELTAEEDRAIAALCYRILMQHEAQEYMTQVSRADSPNGSLQNSYAKGRIQRYKVDLFQAKMGQRDFPFVRINEALSNTAINTAASEDEIREQLKGQRMAFLHGMYALGINSFNDLVNPYFFGAQKWFDKEIVVPILYNLNEKLSDDKKEKIVDNIYTSYITFMLSASPLFGNEEGSSMKSKRDYYLESFPSDYQQIIQENEDIRDLLGNVLQVQQFGSRKRVILQDVGSLSKGQKQDVQRRFDSLLYSDNPVAQKLAKDLLIYSYFDNGLQFTHDSFSHLFTTEFLTNFPVYNETLLSLDEMITPEERDNFIHQFLLTFPEAAYNVNSIISRDNVNASNGTIVIDLNDKKMRKRMINEVMSPNPQLEGINVYPYIQYEGEVYILDKNLFEQYPGTPLYRKLTPYQTFSRLPLFSRQMSVAKMAEEFPLSNDNQQSSQSGPSAPEAPMAHNEGDGNPNIGPDSMYDAFDSMDDFEAPDYDDMMGEPQSDSDTYQSEGEGELQDPFCEA